MKLARCSCVASRCSAPYSQAGSLSLIRYADTGEIKMRYLIVASLIFSACASASPHAIFDGIPADQRPLEVSRVIRLSERMWDAQVGRDKAALDTLIADDFQYFSSKWPLSRAKAEEIAFRTDERETLKSYDIQDPRSTWVDDSALLIRYFVESRIQTSTDLLCPRRGVIETWRFEKGRWLQTARTDWLVGSLVSPNCA